ncbi:MAG: 4-(cytidine 5'-diphospho)-2-C-methyl-D-erythritol kinase [Bacteroidales bacterium]
MILFPNAKINLGLAVTEKRSDGYHNIESIVVPIPLCDTLEILPSKDFQFVNYGLTIDGNWEDNLCVKAYQLFKYEFNLPPVRILLYKNIPMKAGLGGGSSDAVFTLIGLNKMFHLNLTDKQLTDYASTLGSDCPFFIQNTPCFATGRGEILEPIPLNLSGYYIKIIKPQVHISTAKAYQYIQPHKNTVSFKQIIIEKNISEWNNYLFNDFENQAFIQYPILSKYKEDLYNEGALFAGMTGSGSAIFGIYNSMPSKKQSNVFCWISKL